MKLPILLLVTLFIPEQPQTPQSVADELLAADRAFSAASAKTDLISGLAAMFAADVAMPAPGTIAYGLPKAVDALKANPANAGAKASWVPARVAVSSDGTHGFTAGFMTITRADGTVNPAKYLAYWEKQNAGWRVLAYKRTPAKTAAAAAMVSFLLPGAIVDGKNSAAAIEKSRESLAEAERSFSREAQTMGIGEAFKKYGSAEAINLGGPDEPGFVMGNEAIGRSVGSGAPPNTSPVNWGPEKTVIASSVDFGVTIGYIVRNQPAASPSASSAQTPNQPFFTIWRREAGGAWRYIAE
jgi:ketosteroid isomerase-like protein